ncbi:hypothetical protein G6F35_012213 [Rhizopus arrhizus]|nr:hypothetical protein G6F35_012213 [Rhizopus arrhizus]
MAPFWWVSTLVDRLWHHLGCRPAAGTTRIMRPRPARHGSVLVGVDPGRHALAPASMPASGRHYPHHATTANAPWLRFGRCRPWSTRFGISVDAGPRPALPRPPGIACPAHLINLNTPADRCSWPARRCARPAASPSGSRPAWPGRCSARRSAGCGRTAGTGWTAPAPSPGAPSGRCGWRWADRSGTAALRSQPAASDR